MLLESNLRTGPKNQEILPKGYQEFPYLCFHTDLKSYPNGFLHWHWHDSFELCYMKEGSAELRTPEQTVLLHQGDGAFVNSGVPHAYQGMDPVRCSSYSQLFDMHYISGLYHGVLERRYVLPIRESGLAVYAFSPDTPRHLRMASAMLRGVELAREEPFGFEFDLRSALSDFWKDLVLDTQDLRAGSERRSATDSERIKQMMEYVQTHFAGHITLDAIAGAANISPRECTRCFNRCLGMTPIQYVTQYRLQIASDKLLHTSESIGEISEACGFSSPGYFSQTFSETVGCSPREYRASDGAVTQGAC